MLNELWYEHSKMAFPKVLGGKEINGVCVTTLDAKVAGCIDSYVKSGNGQLTITHYQLLEASKGNLESILKYLDAESLEYFRRLHKICSLVTAEASVT
ncbi:hypothetical protein ABMY35_18400 [Pseudoalteromonas sp. BZB3]|uniref:hypothetical protein n=1 Tax=Pseudoalteromonas sp. BZB3 TaxID=3136670 RepID=UPI0032C4798B